MGWHNPDIPWSELERKLSGRPEPHPGANPETDSAPGWTKKRKHRSWEEVRRPDGPVVPYAELHCHSNFSFLDGASDAEKLVATAVGLGLEALAITDHDGFYAAPRIAESAAEYGLRTVYGAELTLDLPEAQVGVADPAGSHLVVLARGVEGYHRLSAAMTEAHLRTAEKGHPVHDPEELAGLGRDHWAVLTGCRKGPVRRALTGGGGATAAGAELDRLVALLGADNVVVELFDHDQPDDSMINDRLVELAADRGLPVVATNNVHYATPGEYRLATAMAAVRARRDLAAMDGWLPPPTAFLRSGEEMITKFRRHPEAVRQSVRLAAECAFDLRAAKPRLPKLKMVAEDHTPTTWLRKLTSDGADDLYRHNRAEAEERLQRELAVIESKGFEGYFLIVHDMVDYARSKGILCQGRGSAANSVVCYVLKITAVDPIKFGLPFERFLSATRDEEPDIDVDFDAARREEVIQEVYHRYGRRNAAQVANVISYRPRSAIRDMAKALGYSTGQQDAWSKQQDSWAAIGAADDHDIPEQVIALANELMGAPRHLGIHSGGMVLTDRPISEVCPIEPARMENRTVLQWDKDGCAVMGLVKFDFLGLGILNAIQHTLTVVAETIGESWTLTSLPKEEPGVYDMLCRADSIGVFQVESRAQIGTLPRLQPRRFYDLVIEVALIRPGPIQGGAVHPFIRRKTGAEPVVYPHPSLEPVLKRTLGVPLFQEQLMQIAMTVGGCTGDDADLLRRAMGSSRGTEKIERLEQKLRQGMTDKGITGALADDIYARIQAFANFGFAESHAISFALLVYASSWLKLHYPGAFLIGLLRAQPMGFYSVQSLTADTRRHGVTVLRPDIVRSGVDSDLEPLEGEEFAEGSPPFPEPVEGPSPMHPLRATGDPRCLHQHQPPAGDFDPEQPDRTAEHRRDGRFAVRLGFTDVHGLGKEVAERLVAARAERPYASMNDVIRRAGLTTAQAEALATAGAFDSFGLSRRQALWNAGYADSIDQLPGSAIDAAPPTLPGMSAAEVTLADLWATRISPDDHPLDHLREVLDRHDILPVGALGAEHDRRRVKVAGLVTHRQRPGTAKGVTFLNLEDETGMLNVVCSASLWSRYRRPARTSNSLVIRGVIEHTSGVTNLVADRIEPLSEVLGELTAVLPARHGSRDFH
ncbi:error-prone DNA polymerase [Microlunatus speluncae]|uniref:error-prone DNA polymerase n=1 Tax=Microlunatus speluncae TaxID=2594267 RepID=UPI00126678A2|nr:error-prone DNA polymerase [Microlunatus speluncae]